MAIVGRDLENAFHSTKLSPNVQYTLTCIAGFLLAVLLMGGLWLIIHCTRRNQKGFKSSKDQWIPFRPGKDIGGKSVISLVQPKYDQNETVRGLSYQPRRSYATSLQPTSSGVSRRQSVPIIPSVFDAHADSAMDFTRRKFSVIANQEESSTEGGSDQEKRTSLYEKTRRRSSTFPVPGSVNRSLYGQEMAFNAHGLGKICFSLSYSREMELLYVKVHRAIYLSVSKKATEFGNFYVKVSLLMNDSENEAQIHKTTVVRSIRNPIFEQEFSFDAKPSYLLTSAILFIIKERRESELGTVTFPLSGVNLLQDEGLNLGGIWRDITRFGSFGKSTGEIYLSLCYKPKASCLCVGVVKCRDLNVNFQESGIFCRLTIMTADKVLKDERSRTIKKDFQYPFIDEEIEFSIGKSLMNNVCLSVTMWRRKNLGFNELIGKCLLGPVTYSDGEGLVHWSTMMHEPEKTIHHWHKLK